MKTLSQKDNIENTKEKVDDSEDELMPLDPPLEPIIWAKEPEVPQRGNTITIEPFLAPNTPSPPTNVDLPETLDELGISTNEQSNLLQNFLKSVCIFFFLMFVILTYYCIII